MKKTIISIVVAAVCASVLSVSAFAEDILSDKSVYANKRESIAVEAGTMDDEGSIISVDPNTVMPYYYANLYDYAQTGNLDIIPYAQKNGKNDVGERFVADAVNSNGEFVGTVEFNIGGSYPGIRVFAPSSNKADSLAFEPNARRISVVMDNRNIDTDCQEVKLVFVVGLGNVYYINNGTSEFLAASNFGGVNGEVFNEENGGIIEIGDDLKAYAEREIAEAEEYNREVIDKLAPGENPPEGGGDATPTFKVDNTPYLTENDSPTTSGSEKNPDTGRGVGIATGAAALISLTAGAVVLAKRRKDNRRNQL